VGHNPKKKIPIPWTLTLPCPLGLKQLTSLIFRFAKSLLAKVVLMTAQRDFRLGNSLMQSDHSASLWRYF
jgi:hypothetical protein